MQDSSPASRTSQSSCDTYEKQRRARIARNNLRVKQLCLVELTSCATRQLQHLTSPIATRKRCRFHQLVAHVNLVEQLCCLSLCIANTHPLRTRCQVKLVLILQVLTRLLLLRDNDKRVSRLSHKTASYGRFCSDE